MFSYKMFLISNLCKPMKVKMRNNGVFYFFLKRFFDDSVVESKQSNSDICF